MMEPTDGFDRQIPRKPALQAATGESMYGTLSEIAFGFKMGKPVITLQS